MGRGKLWVREREEDLPPSVNRAAVPEPRALARVRILPATGAACRDNGRGFHGPGLVAVDVAGPEGGLAAGAAVGACGAASEMG